jgi:PKHD-type hydroxylase
VNGKGLAEQLFTTNPTGNFFHATLSIFTAAECDRIVEFAGAHLGPDRNRACHIRGWAGIPPAPSWMWVYERVVRVMCVANEEQGWRYALDGYTTLQVLRYGVGDEYPWHVDVNPGTAHLPRVFKLTASIILSDPAACRGGDMEVFCGGDTLGGGPAYRLPLDARGTGVTFPTWLPHRVLPVVEGERWSLVVRLAGPPWL